MNLAWTPLPVAVAAAALAVAVLLVLRARAGTRKRWLGAVTAVAALGGTYISRRSARDRAWFGPQLEFAGQRSRRDVALSEDASTTQQRATALRGARGHER